jgi:hypothetical protein
LPTFGVKYDKQQIDAAITHVMDAFPGQIERIPYTVGDDWASEPALFFRVLLKDPNHLYEDLPLRDVATQRDFTGLCRGIIMKLATELHFEMYQPYFEFSTVAEQERLCSPEWA